MVSRFERGGGLGTGQTNHLEAWHRKMSLPKFDKKRIYHSRYWQVRDMLV